MTHLQQFILNITIALLIILIIVLVVFIDSNIFRWIIISIGTALAIILLYIANGSYGKIDVYGLRNTIYKMIRSHAIIIPDKRRIKSDRIGGTIDGSDILITLNPIVGADINNAI